MKELTVEWRHYEKDGATCLRCSGTGKTLAQVVAELQRELAPQEVRIYLIETKLAEDELSASNMVLFNGTLLEELVSGATVAETSCASCSCLTGRDSSCRAIELDGKVYEEIPESLIRKAAYRALGLGKA